MLNFVGKEEWCKSMIDDFDKESARADDITSNKAGLLPDESGAQILLTTITKIFQYISRFYGAVR